ncbi:hypothetical protein SUGI_0254910 [Cryptomeria japonica]|uniref:protein LEAD-SENSITIVE 1 n=1 Tax=Cryptomeria japonica TaxID=3369 RepID=UPI002408C0BF|nr:protein LEAD-SENSITIVE 1 [Cryptomeria japonica]GLJ15519.1 hypothetical protein SUGI_0254910 [Cryptomeria japonica]
MGKLSRSEIVGGDHIYSPRRGYDHHGIYVGENQVIHFTSSPQGTFSASSSAMFGPCSVCGFHGGMSGVVQTCLDCFLDGGDLHRYKYGVDVLLTLLSPRRKTHTSDSPEIVIQRARKLLEQGFGKYDTVSNNCEHFALYCKIGRHISCAQVESIIANVGVSAAGFVINPLLGAGLLSIYAYRRLRTDW